MDYFTQFLPYMADYQDSVYEPDIVEIMFENKLNLVKSKLERITSKIEERVELKDRNLNHLLDDECKIENLMLELPDVFTPYQPPSRDRLDLEKLKLRLQDSRRREFVEAWRDVTMLYNQAIYAYQDLQKIENKKSVVNDL